MDSLKQLNGLIYFLDDYFLTNTGLCENHIHCFLTVCKPLDFPIMMDKVESPATILIFPCQELDSVLQQIWLTLTKLNGRVDTLASLLLLSLLGHSTLGVSSFVLWLYLCCLVIFCSHCLLSMVFLTCMVLKQQQATTNNTS